MLCIFKVLFAVTIYYYKWLMKMKNACACWSKKNNKNEKRKDDEG